MPKINTYTDNASIEDVDALLTYDPAGNGATKLTTFARIASWISSKLSALTKKTSIASTDQILMVDGAASPVVTKRIDYNVLAKAIIEQYASSSLAGANQSVKTAIDALNSNAVLPRSVVRGGTSLNTITTPGAYLCVSMFGANDDAPPSLSNFLLIVTKTNDRYYQKVIEYGTQIEWTRQYWDDWKVWVKQPTRAEVDTLNDNINQSSAYGLLVKHFDMGTNRTLTISSLTSGYPNFVLYGQSSEPIFYLFRGAALTSDNYSVTAKRLDGGTSASIAFTAQKNKIILTMPADYYNIDIITTCKTVTYAISA